jgi:hypothetical protein
MRHKEIKLPTAQCDVIEESSCSSTPWGWVGENRWDERGTCTQRYVCVCIYIYISIYMYVYTEQQKRTQKWLKQQQLYGELDGILT